MAIERWPTPHSTNISEVEYDPDTRLMTVTFKSGGRYAIGGVEATTASDLANDPSPGSYYNRHVRNRYSMKKL